MTDGWRQIAATLADPLRLRVYASVVLGTPSDLPPRKRERALAALESAGLIHMEEDRAIAVDGAFAALLSNSPVTAKTGVDRFLREGRISQFPVRADDRLELLAWVRDRAMPDGVVLTERELGARLGRLTGDVAALRRHLVDAGLVVRDADGGRYWRAP